MLRRSGLRAIAPTRTMVERHMGHWKVVRRAMLPGYALIQCNMTVALYYSLTQMPGVLALIGGAGSKLAPIPEEQIPVFHALMTEYDDLMMGVSYGQRGADGEIRITSGPLARIDRAQIVKIDARRRRATVKVSLYEDVYHVDAALIVGEGEEVTEAHEEPG